ncbi:hypothetical protein QBC36DRAFT_2568 [Triangularia setosa]|uniref:Uncharacterized protein n=1 Tax=Triangularia setosa TaxID=2587417 RepID=A0AAN6WFN5_9PEZI|nr:hypothetical protein QBC36DRAFT_2568 [Podospora setosa]
MPPPPIPLSHSTADSRESATTAAQPRSPALPPLRKKPSAGILTTTTSASGHRTTRITTTAAACPGAPTSTSASSPAVPLSRHPFKRGDQNATSTARGMRAGFDPKAPTPTTARQTAPRMPSYERPGPTGTRQPQMPTVTRTVNSSSKPPLTPKVATRPTTSTQHQNPALATPLPRRPRPDAILSANGSAPRDKLEITSPVSAFLNTSNVTPRSGARQTRVESATSTPNGTPNPERHDALDTRSGFCISPSTADDAISRRPVVTFSPASDVSGGGNRQDLDSKFFYAADVPRQAQQPHPRPLAPQQARSTTFFHASGGPVPDRSTAVSPLASPAATNNDSLMSKFFYANGAPELQPAPKIGPSKKGPSSVVSTASRIPTTRTGNVLRSTSPVGPPVQSKIKSGHSTPLVSPRSPISSSHHRLSVGSQGRSGIEQSSHSVGAEKAHARPKSLTIADAPAIARLMSSHGSTLSSTPSSEAASPLFAPPSAILPGSPGISGFASLLQAAEDFAESEEGRSESLNSPTKSNSQEKEPLSDLVANARRERKVQDLQITNASLEAINRTLERQLRKQTAELRRYKRMSRMSMASLSSRVPSASTVEGGGLARAGMGLNDLSEESEVAAVDAKIEELEEEEEDQKEEEEDQEEDSMSGSEHWESGSSATNTEHNELRQKRDERRLQVDLSKHQQLLVDSQIMNQSLKRCLEWTEELIKEGKRALAYNITVSDVELGGRVLIPDEIETLDPQQEEDDSVIENDVEDYEDVLKDDSLYGEEPRLDHLGGTDTEIDDLKDDSLYGDDPRLDDDLRDDSLYGDNPRLDDDLRDDSLYGDNPRLDDDLKEDSLYGDNPRLDDDLDSTDTEDDKERRKTWRPDPQDRDSGVELPTDSR